MQLTEQEKKHLKELARESIRTALEDEPEPELQIDSDILNEKCGAFVTLTIHGELRGCIGLIVGVKPLYEAVIEMARQAAFNDPRFPALTKSEFDNIEIEISVLSPLETITDPDKIKVGKHGLLIKRGFHSGLLLPQVATEYGWDRETFLRHTCLKAGLPQDSHLDSGTEIQIFTAHVF